jgi:hypothetical protein
MRHFNSIAIAGIVTASSLLSSGGAYAFSSYSTDFEDFPLGSTTPQVNGTPLIGDADGWRGDGLTGLGGQNDYDAEIVDIGGANGQVFRISNPDSAATGNYDTTHPATPAIESAGESITGANNNGFNFSFDFKAASLLEQDGFRVDVTPFQSGTASRQGIFRIEDGPGGLRAGWFEYDGGFNFQQLATDLARDVWHTVSVDMIFNEGAENDVVEVSLNGATTTTTTWEGFYRDSQPSSVQPEAAAIDSVIFRPSTGCSVLGDCTNVEGNGVYFDNFTQSSRLVGSQSVPEPTTTLALVATGLLGMGTLRRRRSHQPANN